MLLRALIREEISNQSFSQNKELIDLAKDAISQLKSQGEDYYEMKALVNALDYSLSNGVVLAKGNPFYGKTTQDLSSEIQKKLDILEAEGIIDSIPEIEVDEIDGSSEDFAKVARELVGRYRGRVPKTFGLDDIANLADDYETFMKIGEVQKAQRFRTELEEKINSFKSKLGI